MHAHDYKLPGIAPARRSATTLSLPPPGPRVRCTATLPAFQPLYVAARACCLQNYKDGQDLLAHLQRRSSKDEFAAWEARHTGSAAARSAKGLPRSLLPRMRRE